MEEHGTSCVGLNGRGEEVRINHPDPLGLGWWLEDTSNEPGAAQWDIKGCPNLMLRPSMHRKDGLLIALYARALELKQELDYEKAKIAPSWEIVVSSLRREVEELKEERDKFKAEAELVELAVQDRDDALEERDEEEQRADNCNESWMQALGWVGDLKMQVARLRAMLRRTRDAIDAQGDTHEVLCEVDSVLGEWATYNAKPDIGHEEPLDPTPGPQVVLDGSDDYTDDYQPPLAEKLDGLLMRMESLEDVVRIAPDSNRDRIDSLEREIRDVWKVHIKQGGHDD